MSYIPSLVYRVQGTLASDVADAGTWTVSYPTGTTLVNFDAGLLKEGLTQTVFNGQNKFLATSTGVNVTTLGASTITMTNNTGATVVAGTTFDIGFPVWASPPETLVIPIALVSITAAGDVVTDIRPGIDGYITNVEWVQGQPVTTAAKLLTFNLEIGTTNLTGGTVALTSATCTPLGARIAGARITALNRITKADKLSVEAASVTAFAEGAGFLIIRFQPDVL